MSVAMRSRSGGVAAEATDHASQTRREIKSAAKSLFAAQGFSATTVRQIAHKVSMKGGSLYYHFGGKDEILYAIFDEGNRLLLDAAEAVLNLGLKDAPSVLRRLIQEHMRILAHDPAQFMVVTRELNTLKGERRQRIAAQRSRYERLIQDVLNRGIKEKTLRSCNVKIVSFGMIAFLNGVAYWFDPDGRLTVAQIAEEYSRVILEGLKA